eukprot:CAMPEP_0185280792 /NCGR_PEP_ID=MMETSP1359-20130426/66350_1 /TAXON_ID=552665 /ORGANISM="Bigelowiella longifila, Strain CCMP242" /LENGTH=68 /DNA_ID=CAMNT_0027876135 /DNA_START=1216 /DNA_END=1422 /DNA_ORIENTATION=-
MSNTWNAVRTNDLPRLKCLVEEHKADVNAKNEEGWTPLIYGCRYGHLDIVKYLISMKANIEAKNRCGG